MVNRTIPPPIKNIDTIQLIPIQNVTFPNQYKVYYLHSDESEIVQLSFFFNAGWIHQNKKLLVDAFSALISSGTLSHSAKEIAEILEFYGVFYNIEPYPADIKLQFTFLRKNFQNVLPIIEEIIKQAHFPQEEIDIYTQTNIEQYQTQIKNVGTVASWHYSKIIHGDKHPLNKLHTPEDYLNITRNDLLEFYTSHIHPKNGFIFISGNIDESILQLLENTFGKEDFHQTQYTYDKNIPLPDSIESHVYTQIPDALQSAIRIGGVIPIYYPHPDYFDLTIANVLLGGYFGSRLMSVIREEKGYTYGIYSTLSSYNNYCVFSIASEVKAEHTQATIDEIIYQIDMLQNEPPNTQELGIVKNYLAGEILDNTDGILKQDNIWKLLIMKKLPDDYYNQLLKRIQEIKSEDISQVMKKYIDTQSLKKCIVGKI